MPVLRSEELAIEREDDVVRVRQVSREWSIELGFSLVDQTKIVTAASELARNTLLHGGGGVAQISLVHGERGQGLSVRFVDSGPGIPDVGLALSDGYSTAGGLGMGLSGSRRLVHDFDLRSDPEGGTEVTITCWADSLRRGFR